MAPRRLTETTEGSFPFEIYKGITYSLAFTWIGGNEEPIDLTGKVLVLKIKDVFSTLFSTASDSAPTALGSSLTITSAIDGQFRIQLDEDETATAVVGSSGNWWIELHDGGDIDLLRPPDCVIVREL